MIKTITRKSELAPIMAKLVASCQNGLGEVFWNTLQKDVLEHKVKFPLLEQLGETLFRHVPPAQQLYLLDTLVEMDYEGGYVIAGTFLSKIMAKNRPLAFEKAVEYYIKGDKWFVVDIIGHRVHGQGLLDNFAQTFPYIQHNLNHDNDWVKRSAGVAIHLATKWGLPKRQVALLLDLALEYAQSNNYQLQKGVGWAAKTIAKFHPDLIEKRQILRDPRVGQWFKKKVQIGLSISQKK